MTSAATVAVDGLDGETKTLISGEENVQQQLDGAVAKKMRLQCRSKIKNLKTPPCMHMARVSHIGASLSYIYS